MNIHVQSFAWTPVFSALGNIHKSVIAGSNGNAMFNFLRNQQFSTVTVPFPILTSNIWWILTLIQGCNMPSSSGWTMIEERQSRLIIFSKKLATIAWHDLPETCHFIIRRWHLFPLSLRMGRPLGLRRGRSAAAPSFRSLRHIRSQGKK